MALICKRIFSIVSGDATSMAMAVTVYVYKNTRNIFKGIKSGVLLHKLVSVQAGNSKVQPAEYKSIPVYTSCLRLRWFHEGEHSEAIR